MSEIFWALTHIGYPNKYMKMKGFFVGTFLTRKDTIKDAVRNYGRSWKSLYREGFRVVRVRVTEISPTRGEKR